MAKSGKPLPKSTTPKAFDVFRPGKTQASPTSRPVIVGHKPAVQDSTVTDKSSSILGEPDYHHIMDSRDKVAVAAPDQEESALYKFVSDDSTGMEELKSDALDPTAESPHSETKKEDHNQAEVAEVATEAGELAVTHDAIVAFHKSSGGKRTLKVFGIAIAIAVVCIALLDVLLDADVIKPTQNIPHTHFLKQ